MDVSQLSPRKLMREVKVVEIARLSKYSSQDAADIGRLMPTLSEELSSQPINEKSLREIISAPNAVQLVARLNGKIVGVATLSTIYSLDVGRNAYLMAFIVDPETQGQGVGGQLWNEMLSWCHDQGIKRLEFTSGSKREAAQHFYLKRGVKIKDTNFFRLEI
jgi:GNAT superfamily N-acetyltransferase